MNKRGLQRREQVVSSMIATATRLGTEEVDVSRAMHLALQEGKSFTDIGRELLPHVNVHLAQMAVARALREALEPELYAFIRERNQANGATEGGFHMFPEGTDRDEGLVSPCECKSGWPDEELADLLRFAMDPACHFVSGPYKGQTSWRVVAQRLNELYAEQRPKRNANSCYRRYRRLTDEPAHADCEKDGTVIESKTG